MRFEPGDTVEVLAECAWTGEVGLVARVTGPIVWVRLPGATLQFCTYEIRHSQEKLPC